jgi:hypothetical protein
MTPNPEPTTVDEQVSHQPDIAQIQPKTQPQLDTGESDPTREAISEALELSSKNLEATMYKWDTLGGVWGSGLFDELARSCKDLEEVAELLKARLDSA